LIFEPRGCFIYALNRIQLFLKRMTLVLYWVATILSEIELKDSVMYLTDASKTGTTLITLRFVIFATY